MADPKEAAPLLVKPDGTRQAVGSTMSREELFDALKLVLGAQQSTEDLAARIASEVAAKATQAALDIADKPELRKGDWNVHNFPDRSVYNPKGEKDAPRADIVGDVWWNGQYLRKNDHTVDECVLINQLKPGVFHNGLWTVKDLAPGVTGKRMLLVLFPCKDPDARNSLPSMLDMLRELTGQTASPSMAVA